MLYTYNNSCQANSNIAGDSCPSFLFFFSFFFIRPFAVLRICWAKWEKDKALKAQVFQLLDWWTDMIFRSMPLKTISPSSLGPDTKNVSSGLLPPPSSLPPGLLISSSPPYTYVDLLLHQRTNIENEYIFCLYWRLSPFSLMDSRVIISSKIWLLIVIKAKHSLQSSSTL